MLILCTLCISFCPLEGPCLQSRDAENSLTSMGKNNVFGTQGEEFSSILWRSLSHNS